MLKNKKTKKLVFTLVIGLAVTIICSAVMVFDPFNTWQLKLSNSLFTRNEPSLDIVIVGIDETSISDAPVGLGKFYEWNRNYYGDVLEKIENAGAKVVGFDLYFSEKSKGIDQDILDGIAESFYSGEEINLKDIISNYLPPSRHPDDVYFADILAQYQNVILAALVKQMLQDLTFEFNKTVLPYDLFSKKYSDIGFVNWKQDQDGVIRKMPISFIDEQDKRYESFPLKIAQLFKENKIDISKIPLENNEMLINYFGQPFTFNRFSFSDIYNDNFKPEDFNDKIVLIGVTTTKAALDEVLVPTSDDFKMPGVEVHANTIQTILEGKFLHNQTLLEKIYIITLVSFLGVFVLLYLNIWFGILFTVVLFIAYLLTSYLAYYNGTIMNLVYPNIAILFTYFGSIIYKYFAELHEKSFIQNAFGRYLSPNVMKEVLENPAMLHLGGTKREVTVLFSDIAGFTTISEQLKPEELILQLNEYLSVMTNIVMQNEGTLDKYVGDAIVAYFGAPIEQVEHAKKTCVTALQMRAALQNLHDKWKKEKKPLLDFRVGINTGDVIVGNVGSEKRFDYTIMGDQVNLGSRLEGANKKYETHIIISEFTLAKIGDEFTVRELDLVRVKGKKKPVRIYELMARKGILSETGDKLLKAYNTAFELYKKHDFQSAFDAFKQALLIRPDDGPSKLYLQRCEILRDFPPAPDWDGVFTMKEK